MANDLDTRTDTERGFFARVFGPPVEAVRRLFRAIQEWLGRHLGRALDFWERLFTGAPPDGESGVSSPTKTAVLLATALVAVFLYGTVPVKDILPWWLFFPLPVAVGAAALVAIRGLSLRGSGSRFEHWLRESQRRVGLVGWERAGLVLAVVASIASLTQPLLLPLTLGAVLGFGLLLGQEVEERELIGVPPVPTLAPPDPDEAGAEDFVDRTFEWTVRHVFGADDHSATVAVHVPTYGRLQKSNTGVVYVGEEQQKIDEYVVAGTTADVERLAVRLRDISERSGYSTFEQVSSALAMVQSIEYSFDQDSKGQKDYWRYPVETMYDETGDCEDTTLLAAALLRRLGHRVVVLLLPRHAALAVDVPQGVPGTFVEHEGRRMYYCETTGEGWRVGEVPDDFADTNVEIYPVPNFRAN